MCVVAGRGVGRQEREALTREKRIGVWKGVKALERKILAGMLRCPLLAYASSADSFFFYPVGTSSLPLAWEEPGPRERQACFLRFPGARAAQGPGTELPAAEVFTSALGRCGGYRESF